MAAKMGNPSKGRRPLGVTILAALEILGGIVALLGGIYVASSGAAAGMLLSSSALGTAAGGVLGGVLIVLGLVALVIAYGFLKGIKWGWWIAIVLYVLGIISGIVSLIAGSYGVIISLIIDAIILYYLTRPHVKSWFGV